LQQRKPQLILTLVHTFNIGMHQTQKWFWNFGFEYWFWGGFGGFGYWFWYGFASLGIGFEKVLVLKE